MPLADRCRPKTFDDMAGQQHLVGPGGILRNMADNHNLQSVIFYGPPGTGKTTAALILAKSAGKPLHKLNGVSASTKDIKAIADGAPDTGCVLYLDEIQYFNKRQQQTLLPYIESGVITLIASTTENPYHDVYDAILSRCIVVEFKRLTPDDIYMRLVNAVLSPEIGLGNICTDVLHFVAQIASGDVRRAFNTVELIVAQYGDRLDTVTIDDVKALLPSAQMAGFDMDGDNHYAYIAALQKSIRGSDPDAAVFWLTKLLSGGDIISPSRRMLVMAYEDIGLAAPEVAGYVLACVQSAEMLGLPEAYKPLTQAALLLALAPKSNSNEPAYMGAQEDIRHGLGATVPKHISKECPPGYVYPHDFVNHWCPQQYMPDDLVGRHYYTPGNNQYEQSLDAYWKHIKSLPAIRRHQ